MHTISCPLVPAKPTTPPVRPIIITRTKTEIPVDSYLRSQTWLRDQDAYLHEQRQRERQNLHSSVMEEVNFVQGLSEKLAQKPKVEGKKEPTEMEQKMLEEIGNVKGMISKRDREEELKNAKDEGFKAGELKGLKVGEDNARKEVWGSSIGFGGNGNGNGNGYGGGWGFGGAGGGGGNGSPWGGGYGPLPMVNAPMGSGNLVSQRHQHSPYYRNDSYEYLAPQGYDARRRRSSASSVTKRVAKRFVEQLDAFGNRISKSIEDIVKEARDARFRDEVERLKEERNRDWQQLLLCRAMGQRAPSPVRRGPIYWTT
jgi:hypothetical protein